VARLTVRCRRVDFGSAGASLFAAPIGTTGGIRKMRGWRRGGCSADDGIEFSAAAVASAGPDCGRGLNRSSAFRRALSSFSRSV
jgi:hypothetical protein